MFQVTKEWLEVFCTDRGGYTSEQVKCLGHKSGLKTKGWKKKSVGLWISDENKKAFEELSKGTLTPAEKKKLKQDAIKARKKAYQDCESVGRFQSVMTTEFIKSPDFLKSFDWLQLRMSVLAKQGNSCECCGATPKDGVKICVDHIKPRKFYPQLALDVKNLQVLCEDCNFGKGNGFPVDWSSV